MNEKLAVKVALGAVAALVAVQVFAGDAMPFAILCVIVGVCAAFWVKRGVRDDPNEGWRRLRAIGVLAVMGSIPLTMAGSTMGLMPLLLAFALLVGSAWLLYYAHGQLGGRYAVNPFNGQTVATTQVAAAALPSQEQRISELRQKRMDAEQKCLDLLAKNHELTAQNDALTRRLQALEFEASLPPDPFADEPSVGRA